MQHRDIVPEPSREAFEELRRQADLRHQHERLSPGRNLLLYEVQVDLGLAAAGDTFE